MNIISYARKGRNHDVHSSISDGAAGGQQGATGRCIAAYLLERGVPVRAFVRKVDDRVDELRKEGAEVFVGDLLNPVSVYEAMKDVDNRRVWEYCSCAPVRILSPSPSGKILHRRIGSRRPSHILKPALFIPGMLLGEPSLQVFEVKGGFLDPEVTVQANGS